MTVNNINIPDNKLRSICRKYSIKELSLFGSALRSDFNPDSDIDFLIEFNKNAGISLFDLVDLKEELELLLKREVDILSKKSIEKSRNYIRKKAILENYQVIYAA